jgi:hypothetical protein
MAAFRLKELNDYLQDTLLIDDDDARRALKAQGLVGLRDFIGLTKDDIKNICTNVRKPGGTIPNPNAGGRNQPAFIPNPGVQLGHIFERRLEQLRYYVYHCNRIQRDLEPEAMMLQRLQVLYHLKESEDATEDEKKIALPKPILKIEDIRTHIEDLDHYLLRKRVSLDYSSLM